MAGTTHNPRWTWLVGAGLTARVAWRSQRLDDETYWRQHTARLQRRQLRRLLRLASHTEIGITHHFARLARRSDETIVEAYRAELPPGDWHAFRDRIQRMREGGEPDVLWPGLIRDFAQTSGTTAGDKYIPVSSMMLRSNYRAAMDIFATAVRFGISLPRLTTGRLLFLGGSTDLAVNEHGIRTGDLSGLVTPMIRWPISEVYAPGREIALMDHWPDKIEAMARSCLDMDIRMVSGMPSWATVLMKRVLELARETGRDAACLRDVWPNIDLLIHGGVNYAPFDARVRELFSGSPRGDDIPHRLELYPASEGFIAIQDTPGDPGLRLLCDIGNFYEFIPLEQIDDDDPPAFTCEQVDKGQRYVVTMTTCAGLWRYVIGDVVEFDTIPAALNGSGGGGGGGPCRLRIVGRHRHFINAFGENLIVEHIEHAVAEAARAAGLVVGEFTAAPVYPAQGRSAGLELVVEIDDVPPSLDFFRDRFDAALKAINVDYTTKRTDGVGMGLPTITPVAPGTFHRWLAERGKLGGQHKCPRCANHRQIIESVLSPTT